MKTDYIKVRLTPELKKDFKKIINSKSINMSSLLTKWIVDYIKEEK